MIGSDRCWSRARPDRGGRRILGQRHLPGGAPRRSGTPATPWPTPPGHCPRPGPATPVDRALTAAAERTYAPRPRPRCYRRRGPATEPRGRRGQRGFPRPDPARSCPPPPRASTPTVPGGRPAGGRRLGFIPGRGRPGGSPAGPPGPEAGADPVPPGRPVLAPVFVEWLMGLPAG